MAITVTFGQDTYTQGQTITCNVVWSGNAAGCPVTYNMKDPNGTILDSGSSILPSGSDTLSYTTSQSTPVGTCTAHGQGYSNQNCTSVSMFQGNDTCVLQGTTYAMTVHLNAETMGWATVKIGGTTYNCTDSPCFYDDIPAGTSITLTAHPYSGYSFVNWTLFDSCTTNPCTFTISSNIFVRANFVLVPTYYHLTYYKDPSAGGTYGASWSGGSCSNTSCYPPCCDILGGTSITFTASPAAGYIFDSFICDDGTESTSNPWVKTINEDITVGCYFVLDPNYYKHLTLQVTGNGDIGTNPACCDYPTGTVVTLTAYPDAGCSFINWTGTNNNNINPTTVTMTSNKTVVAHFTQPSIIISPTSDHYFPDTLVGECSTDEVTYRVISDGQGAAQTVISLADTNANQFQCTNLSLPYTWAGAQGTYLDVTIKFCPTTTGSKYAVLRFVCASCPETYQVGLHGTGTDVPPPNPPCIGTLDPLSFNFPETPVGSCSEPVAWHITNYGDSTAFLMVNWNKPVFQVGDPSWWYDAGPLYWEILAGQTITIYARYCPTIETTESDTILIECRDDITQAPCNLWQIPGVTCGSQIALHVSVGETPPCTPEGSEKCIGGFKYICFEGQWIKKDPEEPCGSECEQYLSQTECETAGCYWYAYPNPFGTPGCFGVPIFIKYLPIIVVGVGAVIVAAALLGKRKTYPMYYPPPPQYGGR